MKLKFDMQCPLTHLRRNIKKQFGSNRKKISTNILPIPGEAKAKAMPGWLYIHTK